MTIKLACNVIGVFSYFPPTSREAIIYDAFCILGYLPGKIGKIVGIVRIAFFSNSLSRPAGEGVIKCNTSFCKAQMVRGIAEICVPSPLLLIADIVGTIAFAVLFILNDEGKRVLQERQI